MPQDLTADVQTAPYLQFLELLYRSADERGLALIEAKDPVRKEDVLVLVMYQSVPEGTALLPIARVFSLDPFRGDPLAGLVVEGFARDSHGRLLYPKDATDALLEPAGGDHVA